MLRSLSAIIAGTAAALVVLLSGCDHRDMVEPTGSSSASLAPIVVVLTDDAARERVRETIEILSSQGQLPRFSLDSDCPPEDEECVCSDPEMEACDGGEEEAAYIKYAWTNVGWLGVNVADSYTEAVSLFKPDITHWIDVVSPISNLFVYGPYNTHTLSSALDFSDACNEYPDALLAVKTDHEVKFLFSTQWDYTYDSDPCVATEW